MNADKNVQLMQKIIRHIDHTLEYCQGQTFESFMNNRMLLEACVFNVMQIGELAGLAQKIGFAAEHPEIVWHEMYGLRNRIAHDYEGTQFRIIWNTISDDFPKLKESLLAILKDIQN